MNHTVTDCCITHRNWWMSELTFMAVFLSCYRKTCHAILFRKVNSLKNAQLLLVSFSYIFYHLEVNLRLLEI